jgi:hypothetical protein
MSKVVFLLLGFLTLLVLPASLPAQESGPDILATAIGTWEDEDGARARCDWLGESTLLCLQSWTTESGEQRQGAFVTSWDADTEMYTVDRFSSTGYQDSGVVWIDGNKWVYVFHNPNGAILRATQLWNDDTVEYEWHRSLRGGPWEPTGSKGSMTRTAAQGSLFEQ